MSTYEYLRPLLFRLPAETAHSVVHAVLRGVQDTPLRAVLQDHYAVEDDRLRVEAFGQSFPNPVGVAAGFDKNARIPAALSALGFGHVEVGGVTAEAQSGNPRPRLFRLPADGALINRMGFNNHGADAVGERLTAVDPGVPVGVNIGLSRSASPATAEQDYRYTYRRVARGGDYFVVNVSSPNTPGVRSLQERSHLETILGTLREAGASPLLVKLSPDLAEPAIAEALTVVEDLDVDGVVATNTTTDRPATLASPHRVESGGLSGRPLAERSTRIVRFLARRTDLPLVGVGGVTSAEDAYEKIRAGASLVQLYTGLIYEGPSIARAINSGLIDRLERDGFASVQDAVGADL